MNNTNRQFEEVIDICRNVFTDKSKDYGPTWRILRPESVTDQLLIKANRIRTLEVKKEIYQMREHWSCITNILQPPQSSCMLKIMTMMRLGEV